MIDMVLIGFKALEITSKQQNRMKSLKNRERQAKIVLALRQHGNMSVAEAAALTGVSEETVRRDARELQDSGQVLKLHGALALPHNMGEVHL